METIGSKRSYALIWCMPNNDDDSVFTTSLLFVNTSFNNRSTSFHLTELDITVSL